MMIVATAMTRPFGDVLAEHQDDLRRWVDTYWNNWPSLRLESSWEDAHQEAQIALWRSWKAFSVSGPASFRTYARRAVRNALIKIAFPNARTADSGARMVPISDLDVPLEGYLGRLDDIDEVHEALSRLSQQDQEVLRVKFGISGDTSSMDLAELYGRRWNRECDGALFRFAEMVYLLRGRTWD
jgi:RNA polymerase sigma factor (sigma-70 family)